MVQDADKKKESETMKKLLIYLRVQSSLSELSFLCEIMKRIEKLEQYHDLGLFTIYNIFILGINYLSYWIYSPYIEAIAIPFALSELFELSNYFFPKYVDYLRKKITIKPISSFILFTFISIFLALDTTLTHSISLIATSMLATITGHYLLIFTHKLMDSLIWKFC